MAKKKKVAATPYVLPGAAATTHKKWRTAAMLVGIALALAVAAAHFLLREQPLLVVWLMGLLCASGATVVFVLATHEPEHDDLAMRLQRGQHLDFGKALRTSRKERRKVKLPVIGETTVRRLVGTGIWVVVFAWWLTPWAPVAVAERKIEDLSVPLTGEILAPVLVMPDPHLAVLLPPVVSARARQLAAGIPDDAGALQRGRKAIAEGRFADARELLQGGLSGAADAAEVQAAIGQAELYAYRFAESLAAFKKAMEGKTPEPSVLCQAAVAAIHLNRYDEAEPWIGQAIKVLEDKPEAGRAASDQALLAAAAGLRAALLTIRGKTPKELDEAERLYDQAKAAQSKEEVFGPEHPYLAATVNNQAVLNQLRAKLPGVPALHNQARDLWRASIGARHPYVAASLDNLAMYHLVFGRYTDARQCSEQSLAILRENYPAEIPTNPILAVGLNVSSIVERTFARYAEAKGPAEQALDVFEKVFGPDHPAVAAAVNALASLNGDLAQYLTIARPFYLRVEQTASKTLGPEHPFVAVTLNKEAGLYLAERAYGPSVETARKALAPAKETAEKALAIAKKAYGERHPVVAAILNTLGRVAFEAGDPLGAKPHLDEALRILEETVGKEGPELAATLGNLAALDSGPVTFAKGVKRYEQAIKMTEGFFGPEYKDQPVVARLLCRAGQLLTQRGKYAEAEPYLKRALEIQEAVLVPSQAYHPEVADTLEAYAELLRKSDPPQTARADKLAARAKDIRDKHFEQDRPAAPSK